MKNLMLACLLACLVACSSPSESSTPPSSEPSAPTTPETEQPAPSTPEPSETYRGEAIRTFKGKVENYSSGQAILKAYTSDRPSYQDENTLGSGQIEADGSFTFEFRETIEESESYSFACEEDPFPETITGIKGVGAVQIYVQAFEEPYEDGIYGTLVFATSDSDWLFLGAEPKKGDKILMWQYAFEDRELSRTCDNGVMFDLAFEEGWNTVEGFVEESGIKLRMAGMSDTLSWFFVPPEIQEEPEDSGSGTADTGGDGETEGEDTDDTGGDGDTDDTGGDGDTGESDGPWEEPEEYDDSGNDD